MVMLLIVAITALCLAKCVESHIVNIEEDFNKVKSDEALAKYVEEILDRLKTFKVPVHPRIRLFYQLLKKGIDEYADQTSDTIFVPFKYNVPKDKLPKADAKDSGASKEAKNSEESKKSSKESEESNKNSKESKESKKNSKESKESKKNSKESKESKKNSKESNESEK